MKAWKRILSLFTATAILLSAMVGSAAVLTSAAEGDLVISDCDTLDGWTKTGGNALQAPQVAARSQGSLGAIQCDVSYGAFRTATYTLPDSIDLTNYTSIEWDAMFFANGDSTGLMWNQVQAAYGTNGNNTLLLKLMSEDSDNDRAIWRLSALEATQPYANLNWVHFKANLSSPNTDVNFDITKVKKFYFASCDGAVDTSVSNGQIRLDNIKATGYHDPAVETKMISDCESTTGWTYAGNATIQTSAAGLTGGAIRVDGGTGILRKLTYTAASPIDLTGYTTVEWDMTALAAGSLVDQLETITQAYTDSVGVEISDGTNTATYSLYDLRIDSVNKDWWHLAVKLDGEALDLSNITSFAVYTKPTGLGDSEIGTTFYKIDNLIADTAEITPNGYDFASVIDRLLEDCEDKAGWTYRGSADNTNMTINPNGKTGSAIQVFAGYGKVGPTKYTFSEAVNISRHGFLRFHVRFLKAGAADDLWETIRTAYAEYIQAELTDASGSTYVYDLSKMAIEADGTGWYTVTLNLDRARNLNLAALKAFSFRVTDTYADESVPNVNMRIDNLYAIPPMDLETGDVNGDGTVDVLDLVRLEKYFAGLDVEVYLAAADVSGNGTVENEDLVLLRKALLGVEITPAYAPLATTGWSEVVKP